jgi:hypothetical protein
MAGIEAFRREGNPPPRTLLWIEVGVLLACLAVRLFSLISIGRTDYARYPMVDAYTYWNQAQQLFAGENPFAEGLYQPAAYPLFVAATGLLFGQPDLVGLRWIQLVLGFATAWILVRLGRRIGSPLGAPWVGAAAALIYSMHPGILMYEQDVLTPALSGFLTVAALSLSLGSGRLGCGLSGLCSGLAASVHPTLLLASGALGGAVWRRSGRLLPFAAGLAIALAPSVSYNSAQGMPALVSHNAGINFYIGNSTDWKETSFLRPGLPFRRLALEAEPHLRTLPERNSYWIKRALSDISGSPAGWAGAILEKGYWSIHAREIPRNEDYRCRYQNPALGWMGLLPSRWGWVFPLAIAGLLAHRKEPLVKSTGLLWLSVHLPLLLFLVSDRYRVSCWPFLSLLAPLGLLWIWRSRRRGRALLPLLPVALLPWMPIDARTGIQQDWCDHVSANLAYMESRKEEAEALYRRSLSVNPGNLSARVYLSAIHEGRKEYSLALSEMERVAGDFPGHFPSLRSLARIYEKMGDFSGAADAMGRAYRVPGNRRSTGVRYLELLIKADRKADAEAFWEENGWLSSHPKSSRLRRLLE